MTQTNTDYLFQVTAPAPDRPFAATGATDGAPKFDDHLSQASNFSGDDSHNLGSGSQRTETGRYERDDRTWNTRASKPDNRESENSTSPQTLPSNHEAPSDQLDESKPPVEKAEGEVEIVHDDDREPIGRARHQSLYHIDPVPDVEACSRFVRKSRGILARLQRSTKGACWRPVPDTSRWS